jgi:hypothetical protein
MCTHTAFAPYLNCAISRKAILSRQTAEAECVSRNSSTENDAVSMQHVLGSQLSFNNRLGTPRYQTIHHQRKRIFYQTQYSPLHVSGEHITRQ